MITWYWEVRDPILSAQVSQAHLYRLLMTHPTVSAILPTQRFCLTCESIHTFENILKTHLRLFCFHIKGANDEELRPGIFFTISLSSPGFSGKFGVNDWSNQQHLLNIHVFLLFLYNWYNESLYANFQILWAQKIFEITNDAHLTNVGQASRTVSRMFNYWFQRLHFYNFLLKIPRLLSAKISPERWF